MLSSRRAVVAVELAACAALLASALLERHARGLQRDFLLVAGMTAFLHLHRLLFVLRLARAPGALAQVLEGAAVLGTFFWYPPRLWLVALAWTGVLVDGLGTALVPKKERTSRHKLLLGTSMALAMTSILWTIGEVAFLALPNHYRDMVVPRLDGWHAPGGTSVYEGALLHEKQEKPVLVHWNKAGWHDADHELAKPPKTARVLVLGDSFVEGCQVELEELFHRRLERLLAARSETPVEAIAIGFAGWGQAQEAPALEEHGLAYAPDLVLLEFLPGNDVRNNQDDLERLAREETTSSSLAKPLFHDAMSSSMYFSAFVLDHLDAALRSLGGRKDPIDDEVYRPSPRIRPELWADAWRKTEDLVARIRDRTKEHGAQLVVAVFAARVEVDAIASGERSTEVDHALPARRMKEICERLGVPCLDLAPRFARLAPEERARLHLENDGHWTALGHERAAEETARFLTDETSLWKETLARVR
jgi:hypothetical protein